MKVPLQYKTLYLLAFLFAHQTEKFIVFVSTCEEVNYFYKLLTNINWFEFWDRELKEQKFFLFNDKVFKLHGSIDHSERKTTFE